MKQDTQKTKVLFLIESTGNPDIFAFFPEDRYNSASNLFGSYAHIGQYSACHIDYANKCLQATQEQYAALKIELEGLGYDLEVLNEQPPAPIKEDADISKISTEELQWRVDNPEGAKWFDAYKESNQQYLQLAELCIKYKEQVNVLREALQLLTNSTNLSKLNIRKDFTLINAHANGLKALKKTETN